MDDQCPMQPREMMQTFIAALEQTHGDPNLTSAYAEFAVRVLGDSELGERLAREVVAAHPREPIYRTNLIRFLIQDRKFDAASEEIDEFAKLNELGSLDRVLASLKKQLADARAADSAKAAEPPPEARADGGPTSGSPGEK